MPNYRVYILPSVAGEQNPDYSTYTSYYSAPCLSIMADSLQAPDAEADSTGVSLPSRFTDNSTKSGQA
jgi:hypothetical protein